MNYNQKHDKLGLKVHVGMCRITISKRWHRILIDQVANPGYFISLHFQ